jgi:hypothetical protein
MKLISKFISLFLSLLCISNAAHAFDSAVFTESGLQKHYIQASEVKVADDGIFVNFEGDTLIVSSVFVDADGAYIAGMGHCRVCGRPNDDMGRCQWPRCPNYGKG